MKRQNSLFSGAIILSSLALGITLFSCKGKSAAQEDAKLSDISPLTEEQLKELKEQANGIFASITTLPDEKISDDLILLGKKLYYDNRLSKNETVSCASCHKLEAYGVDNLSFSPGDTKELGGRNSPSSYYAFAHAMQFWDGRVKDVEEQAGGPIMNPVEHNIPSQSFLEKRLRGVDEYKTLFSKAFPETVQPITFNNITKAIGAFERQLKPESRFDKWLDGDDNALTIDEKVGLKTFMETGCITCHNGVTIGGGMFQKFGLFGNYWELTKSKKVDFGRYDVTKTETDKYFFKVPSLRNVAMTYPYFHDGSVDNLEETVRIMAKLQNNKDLTDKEVAEITAFLKSLTMELDEKTKALIKQ
jgi:cytochrome c peroxidase